MLGESRGWGLKLIVVELKFGTVRHCWQLSSQMNIDGIFVNWLNKLFVNCTFLAIILHFFSASVVVTFFLCWAPFHTQRLTFVYFKDTELFRAVNEYLFHVSGFFYYFSATLNPILYNVMSLKYRQAKQSQLLY